MVACRDACSRERQWMRSQALFCAPMSRLGLAKSRPIWQRMEISHRSFPQGYIFELHALGLFTKARDARSSGSVLIQRSPELRRKEGEQRTLATVNQYFQSRGSLQEGRHSYGFCAVPSSAENVRPGGAGGEGGIRTPDTVTRMPHFECGAFNH